MKKILYGVCGIGTGHMQRQLPFVEHFARSARVVVFAYGKSLDFYRAYFKDSSSVTVLEVAVPFYIAGKDGIDVGASMKLPQNGGIDFEGINKRAADDAFKMLGTPDLVVSDYEPESARYAYTYNAPLITVDQQSKYLLKGFPENLEGYTYADEVARLLFFFPHAELRIACSFFAVPANDNPHHVVIAPPPIRKEFEVMQREPVANSFAVYISSARDFGQEPEAIAYILGAQKRATFHLFAGREALDQLRRMVLPQNVFAHLYGDPEFLRVISGCSGVIATAGHSLLSEAMYLGIPVYAIPVAPYEQYMNARIVDSHGFGVAHKELDKEKLGYFIENVPQFSENILKDTTVLMRGNGTEKIIELLEEKID
ncbi:MAG TPA: glycosyltransferase family protein [Candidatus Paceibacterota bacterium]